MKENAQLETLLSHMAEVGGITDPYGATHMPIYNTATFDLKRQNSDAPYDYTRSGSPTRESMENLFAKVCGGVGAVCTHTGLGAVALLFETVLFAGDKILVEKDTYGGTFRLLKQYQKRMNLKVLFADFSDLAHVGSLLADESISLVLIESPTNPGLKVIDLKAVAKLTKSTNTLFAVDNSLATFVGQKPLELGADYSLFSTTKYVSGHGSVVGGVLATNSKGQLADLRFTANAQARSQNPMDTYITSLGVPTLPLRMKAHQSAALEIARWLENHDKVVKVTYPGLPSHPQHELAKKQMKNFSGVLTCELTSVAIAKKMIATSELFGEKVSFGTADSRIEIPGEMSHATFSEEELNDIGITPATVRLSIGLEAVEDLIHDLQEALA